MPECQSCGSHVTARYARSMGDNDNNVYRCPRCPDISRGDRYEGGAAGRDTQEVRA